MKKLFCLLSLLIVVRPCNAQRIPQYFWGINHWMPQYYIYFQTAPVNGKIELPGVQQLVSNGGAAVYRIGGNGYDEEGIAIGGDSLTNDYIRAMYIVRRHNPNAKFIIQVPFKGGNFTADSVIKMVTNIQAEFNNESFYYTIGNEWDFYRHPGNIKYGSIYISNSIKRFAVAVKTADSLAKIVGPSLSSYSVTDSLGNKIMNRLFGGPDSLHHVMTGTGVQSLDGKRCYIDVLDFHTYGGQFGDLYSVTDETSYWTHRNGLISYAGVSGTGYSNTMDTVIARCNLVNARRPSNVDRLSFGITEMNVGYTNQSRFLGTANHHKNTTEGLSARSFFAGQYWADLMSTTLAKGTSVSASAPKVEWVMPWSIHEGGGDGDSTDLGMTKGPASLSTPPVPLSTYYHYKLMSQHFLGRFYTGSSSIGPKVKTFASAEDSAGIYVMILNRDTIEHKFSIGFQNNSPTAALELDFNIPSSILPLDSATTYPSSLSPGGDTIGPNTTVLLLINCHGRRLFKMDYSLSDAMGDGEPHLEMINNKHVDPDLGTCEEGLFEGDVVSDVSFSDQIVYVTGDVNLIGSKLTFDNAVVVINPGVTISGDNTSSLEITNGSVLYGCNGPWQGIELQGNNSAGQKLIIDHSYIYNARYPVIATQVPDVSIKGNILANGATGITLDGCELFAIENNVIGCYTIGIATENTPPGYSSSIKGNELVHTETSISSNQDDHMLLDLSCNILNFFEYGLHTTNTNLNDIGMPSMSGGNIFHNYGTTPENFIEHSGNAPTYYAGPYETSLYSGLTVMNITQATAPTDNLCAASILAAFTCKQLQSVGISEQSIRDNPIKIFPNPSSGTFYIERTGQYHLSVYDMMGRLVIEKDVNGSIDIHIDSKGIFLINVESEGTRASTKVIVQ